MKKKVGNSLADKIKFLEWAGKKKADGKLIVDYEDQMLDIINKDPVIKALLKEYVKNYGKMTVLQVVEKLKELQNRPVRRMSTSQFKKLKELQNKPVIGIQRPKSIIRRSIAK